MLMSPSDKSKLVFGGGASEVVRWGEAFRWLVRGTHSHLVVWTLCSERADLTKKGGYSAWIEGRTQMVLGEGFGERHNMGVRVGANARRVASKS